MLEERLEPLQIENDQLVQRFEQNEALVQSVKQDFQQILNYKNDLDLLIEDQTQQLEAKNKKLFGYEDVEHRHAHELEQLEHKLRTTTQQSEESKKKLLQAEVKIR